MLDQEPQHINRFGPRCGGDARHENPLNRGKTEPVSGIDRLTLRNRHPAVTTYHSLASGTQTEISPDLVDVCEFNSRCDAEDEVEIHREVLIFIVRAHQLVQRAMVEVGRRVEGELDELQSKQELP